MFADCWRDPLPGGGARHEAHLTGQGKAVPAGEDRVKTVQGLDRRKKSHRTTTKIAVKTPKLEWGVSDGKEGARFLWLFFSAFAFVKALESVELQTQSYIFSCSAASRGFLHVSSPAVKKRCVFFHLLQKFFCNEWLAQIDPPFCKVEKNNS